MQTDSWYRVENAGTNTHVLWKHKMVRDRHEYLINDAGAAGYPYGKKTKFRLQAYSYGGKIRSLFHTKYQNKF